MKLDERFSKFEARQGDKYAHLPLAEKAKFWAKQKGRTPTTFHAWIKANGLQDKVMDGGYWPKEIGIRWIEG